MTMPLHSLKPAICSLFRIFHIHHLVSFNVYVHIVSIVYTHPTLCWFAPCLMHQCFCLTLQFGCLFFSFTLLYLSRGDVVFGVLVVIRKSKFLTQVGWSQSLWVQWFVTPLTVGICEFEFFKFRLLWALPRYLRLLARTLISFSQNMIEAWSSVFLPEQNPGSKKKYWKHWNTPENPCYSETTKH
jgi:hypothetical protein